MTDFLPNPLALAFWLCLGLVFYTYVAYPAVIWLLARCFGRPNGHEPPPLAELPTVSLVISAHNEEEVIEDRVRNALALDYPADKLEILIASDGSSDGTAAIVRRYADRGVRLLDFPVRRGKATALNNAVPQARGEILLLSDANTHFEPASVRRLVRWFQDPGVAVVCGRLVLTDTESGKNVDGLYWRYETFLKKCEGRLGALLGSNGAIYAMRKSLFAPIPADTIIDDFVIPLQARLRSGGEIVYECGAVAVEETAPDVSAEFRRRTRIGAGGFQSIGRLWPLLNPRRGWVAFTFLSHKILRWLCPFFLLGALACNLLLLSDPPYRLTLLAQAAFYHLSALAAFVPARVRVLKPLRLTTMFTSMNLALFMGFVRWLRGSQKAAWHRTPRLTGANGAVR